MRRSSQHEACVTQKRRPICGFIGLGSQGAPIAMRIIKAGYPVCYGRGARRHWNDLMRRRRACVASITELGSKVDHVGICVSDEAAVREVCDELIPSMRPGSRIADSFNHAPKYLQRNRTPSSPP